MIRSRILLLVGSKEIGRALESMEGSLIGFIVGMIIVSFSSAKTLQLFRVALKISLSHGQVEGSFIYAREGSISAPGALRGFILATARRASFREIGIKAKPACVE